VNPFYENEGIVVYCGDSRELLPMLGLSSYNLLLTDPPWGISLDCSYGASRHKSAVEERNKTGGKAHGLVQQRSSSDNRRQHAV